MTFSDIFSAHNTVNNNNNTVHDDNSPLISLNKDEIPVFYSRKPLNHHNYTNNIYPINDSFDPLFAITTPTLLVPYADIYRDKTNINNQQQISTNDVAIIKQQYLSPIRNYLNTFNTLQVKYPDLAQHCIFGHSKVYAIHFVLFLLQQFLFEPILSLLLFPLFNDTNYNNNNDNNNNDNDNSNQNLINKKQLYSVVPLVQHAAFNIFTLNKRNQQYKMNNIEQNLQQDYMKQLHNQYQSYLFTVYQSIVSLYDFTQVKIDICRQKAAQDERNSSFHVEKNYFSPIYPSVLLPPVLSSALTSSTAVQVEDEITASISIIPISSTTNNIMPRNTTIVPISNNKQAIMNGINKTLPVHHFTNTQLNQIVISSAEILDNTLNIVSNSHAVATEHLLQTAAHIILIDSFLNQFD
jgi:hypothetical protein